MAHTSIVGWIALALTIINAAAITIRGRRHRPKPPTKRLALPTAVATAAIVEIIERDHATDDTPGGSIIVPNEVRLNGVPLLAPTDHPVTVHEITTRPDGAVLVTLTLFARRVSIRAEQDEP